MILLERLIDSQNAIGFKVKTSIDFTPDRRVRLFSGHWKIYKRSPLPMVVAHEFVEIQMLRFFRNQSDHRAEL